MAAGEIVAVHAVLVLEMADDGLDGGAASHLTFDLRGDAALLLGGVDFELGFGRGVVAAVAGISMEPLDGVADERLDRRDDAGEGVSVVNSVRRNSRDHPCREGASGYFTDDYVFVAFLLEAPTKLAFAFLLPASPANYRA